MRNKTIHIIGMIIVFIIAMITLLLVYHLDQERCYNKSNKHAFEAVYDEVPSEEEVLEYTGSMELLDNILTNKIYVKHVCKWCGKKIKRRQ